VIDFRYHLVSLIAVFLAVALGIVIGTTQLNGPLTDNLQGQVTALQADKRSLEDQTQLLQTAAASAQSGLVAFLTSSAGLALLGGLVLLLLLRRRGRRSSRRARLIFEF